MFPGFQGAPAHRRHASSALRARTNRSPLKVRQHRRVDDEGGDCGGERRELVAAGLGGTTLVSSDKGGC